MAAHAGSGAAGRHRVHCLAFHQRPGVRAGGTGGRGEDRRLRSIHRRRGRRLRFPAHSYAPGRRRGARVITVLAGGVGAARFLQGLVAVHPPSNITVISNVGDDAEFFGLHVSPDIDIVLYHLAGVADEERGFGIKDDTFAVLDAIGRYGYDTWFRLGDRDLATCVTRTDLLRRGRTLSQATAEIASALLVPVRITPATKDPLRTRIRTDEGVLDFQDYFVRRRTEGHVREVIFHGADTATPAPGVLEAIHEA